MCEEPPKCRYVTKTSTIQTVNSPRGGGEWCWIGVISLPNPSVLELILQDVSFVTMKAAPLGFSKGFKACDFDLVFGYFCAC